MDGRDYDPRRDYVCDRPVEVTGWLLGLFGLARCVDRVGGEQVRTDDGGTVPLPAYGLRCLVAG